MGTQMLTLLPSILSMKPKQTGRMEGFLIDSFDRSDLMRAALTLEGIHFEQAKDVDNILAIKWADRQRVVDIANRLGIEWQWAELT